MPRRGQVTRPKSRIFFFVIGISCILSVLLSEPVGSERTRRPLAEAVPMPGQKRSSESTQTTSKVPKSMSPKQSKEEVAGISHTRIRYKTVETGDEEIFRYAAVTCQEDSSQSTPCDEGESADWIPLSVQKWTELLLSDVTLMNQFYGLLKNTMEWPSYFFETKGISSQNASQVQFEFVLVISTELNASINTSGVNMNAFSSHWRTVLPGETCTSFRNLSGDAMLVVPKPMPDTEPSTYSDLASFIRTAPSSEIFNMWTKSLQEYQRLIGPSSNGRTVWFSTSGLGISYLHMRFDSRPKYYSYEPFQISKSL